MRACFCPSCGASLNLDDENRDFGFCQYCGAKIMLDDYRSTHRVVDEARIREDETYRMVRMREIDIEEREWENIKQEFAKKHKIAIRAYCIGFILLVIGFICFLSLDNFVELLSLNIGSVGFLTLLLTFIIDIDNQTELKDMTKARISKKIIFNFEINNYWGANYQVIRDKIEKLGFTNVSVINMEDLKRNFLIKSEKIYSVTINGGMPRKGEWYDPDAEVVIKYHGFKSEH